MALGVLQVELRRDLVTHTALVTGLSAVDLASDASAVSQQVQGVWGTVSSQQEINTLDVILKNYQLTEETLGPHL